MYYNFIHFKNIVQNEFDPFACPDSQRYTIVQHACNFAQELPK